jgi:hypothetical protein
MLLQYVVAAAQWRGFPFNCTSASMFYVLQDEKWHHKNFFSPIATVGGLNYCIFL